MAKSWRVFFTICGTILVFSLYQNCGDGFQVLSPSEIESTELGSSSSANGESNIDLEKLDLDYEVFLNCKKTSGVGFANVVTCLNSNNIKIDNGMTQEDVNSCVTATGGGDIDVAFCLAKKGKALKRYRDLTQWDLNKCNQNVGPSKIANCLDNNGVLPLGLSQSTIDSCLAKVGLSGIEGCLRKNKVLTKSFGLMQFDVNICSKIVGDNNNDLIDCLNNKGVWPMTLTSTDLQNCRNANEGELSKVAWCLRKNFKLGPIVLTQNHVNRCIRAVGDAGAGNCIVANGFFANFPSGVTPPTDAAIATQIRNCISINRNAVPSCLRSNNYLPRVITQPDLNACAWLDGENNVETCLKNSGLLHSGITQAQITACSEARQTFSEVVFCLRKAKKILPRAIMSGDVVACARMVGDDKIHGCLNANGFDVSNIPSNVIDSCEVAKETVGIPFCLRQAQGLSRKVLMMDHVKSCLWHTGSIDKLGACLSLNGLDLGDRVTQANLKSCDTAVNARNSTVPNILWCMAAREHISPIPSQDFFDSCVDFAGKDSSAACLKTHGRLPPLTTQDEIDICIGNNGGSTGSVIACLTARGKIAPTLDMLMANSGVFKQKNCITCHGSESNNTVAKNSFDMSTPENIRARIGKVNGVNTGRSVGNMTMIMDRVNTGDRNLRMPLGQTQLSASEKDMLRYWILTGAN